MELEFKHIAPYLPHDLKVNNSQGNQVEIRGFIDFKYMQYYCEKTNFASQDLISDIKPLLRPMSDLFKGSKKAIKEIIELNDSYDYNNSFTEVYDSNEDYYLDFSNVKNLPYQVVEVLFKYHFDVFALIEKGLAEPIKND